PIDLSKK
nr:Chain B, PRO-ILE-ASP-LEU-SER-LYS-LYS PEPTIDE [synthetic construct]